MVLNAGFRGSHKCQRLCQGVLQYLSNAHPLNSLGKSVGHISPKILTRMTISNSFTRTSHTHHFPFKNAYISQCTLEPQPVHYYYETTNYTFPTVEILAPSSLDAPTQKRHKNTKP
mmetsp:Transcript_36196/g.63496  ORF Transcript_36196/g.63496 Transcript_36196/m.63496 type:complete len:116 (+) Transcript_36196:310-657(+)